MRSPTLETSSNTHFQLSYQSRLDLNSTHHQATVSTPTHHFHLSHHDPPQAPPSNSHRTPCHCPLHLPTLTPSLISPSLSENKTYLFLPLPYPNPHLQPPENAGPETSSPPLLALETGDREPGTPPSTPLNCWLGAWRPSEVAEGLEDGKVYWFTRTADPEGWLLAYEVGDRGEEGLTGTNGGV
ncbi:hypothetical protein MBLNU230_g3225t1 [Neophaeotheca triangularis]